MATRNIRKSNATTERPASIRVRRLRNKFDLTQPKFARVLGISQRRLADLEAGQTPSESIHRRITEADRLRSALGKLVKNQAIGPWMDQPNKAFGGRRPIQVIEDGQIDLLWAMIYQIQSGNPS